MARWIILSLLVPFLFAASCEKLKEGQAKDPNPYLRVMFYNVENLFDIEDDPLVNDEEFTPSSEKEWNQVKYQEKLSRIAWVIGAAGKDTLPPLVGLAEIENRGTLVDLLNTSPLAGQDYKIIHQESPDLRGIDVALLYRANFFTPLSTNFIRLSFPSDTALRSRDILFCKGVLVTGDTLCLFVNHWPSRSSGEVESRPLRMVAALAVKERIDSIRATDPGAKIIVMGDFNDEPQDLSVISGLQAQLAFGNIQPTGLYDLTISLKDDFPGGTYKYKGTWNLLDHIVVSGTLMDTTRNLYVKSSDIHAFAISRILEEDKQNLGEQPFRTYWGNNYHGGYSDHLPVYLDLHYKSR
jgi:predicted extracellular nuclease